MKMFLGAESQQLRAEPQNQGKQAFLMCDQAQALTMPLAVSENATDLEHKHLSFLQASNQDWASEIVPGHLILSVF